MAMQALHALCLTEPALCTPAEDPERFCRCLGPYIKAGTNDRRAAEQLMCILSILVCPAAFICMFRQAMLPLSTRSAGLGDGGTFPTPFAST